MRTNTGSIRTAPVGQALGFMAGAAVYEPASSLPLSVLNRVRVKRAGPLELRTACLVEIIDVVRDS
ncbi:hypothetical protein ACFPRL_16385 [Pseudoclavibacter helvolus]